MIVTRILNIIIYRKLQWNEYQYGHMYININMKVV